MTKRFVVTKKTPTRSEGSSGVLGRSTALMAARVVENYILERRADWSSREYYLDCIKDIISAIQEIRTG